PPSYRRRRGTRSQKRVSTPLPGGVAPRLTQGAGSRVTRATRRRAHPAGGRAGARARAALRRPRAGRECGVRWRGHPAWRASARNAAGVLARAGRARVTSERWARRSTMAQTRTWPVLVALVLLAVALRGQPAEAVEDRLQGIHT